MDLQKYLHLRLLQDRIYISFEPALVNENDYFINPIKLIYGPKMEILSSIL